MDQSPYQAVLQRYAKEGGVIVHRANAPDVEGGAYRIFDDGVCIRCQDPQGHAGDDIETFVAYSDIRGISRRIKGDGN